MFYAIDFLKIFVSMGQDLTCDGFYSKVWKFRFFKHFSINITGLKMDTKMVSIATVTFYFDSQGQTID